MDALAHKITPSSPCPSVFNNMQMVLLQLKAPTLELEGDQTSVYGEA
jgi:hypothetical protein